MPDRKQSHPSSASFERLLPRGLCAMGLRLRLIRELSVGLVALCHEAAGKLLLTSPVINQR